MATNPFNFDKGVFGEGWGAHKGTAAISIIIRYPLMCASRLTFGLGLFMWFSIYMVGHTWWDLRERGNPVGEYPWATWFMIVLGCMGATWVVGQSRAVMMGKQFGNVDLTDFNIFEYISDYYETFIGGMSLIMFSMFFIGGAFFEFIDDHVRYVMYFGYLVLIWVLVRREAELQQYYLENHGSVITWYIRMRHGKALEEGVFEVEDTPSTRELDKSIEEDDEILAKMDACATEEEAERIGREYMARKGIK